MKISFPNQRLLFWVGLIGCLLVGWVYCNLVDLEIAGFTRDDGIYLVLGKALASGKGLALLNMPGDPWQVKYPIGYPLLLALGWLIHPQYPENLALLSYLTIGFTILGLMTVFIYLHRFKQAPPLIALGIVLAMAFNFYFIYFATSIMAEGPYLLFSFLTLLTAEAWINKPTDKKWFWLTILLSAATFHMRQIGLSLGLAIGLWLLSKKLWKPAILYGISVLLLTALPWGWWVLTHYHPSNLDLPMKALYAPYTQELVNNVHLTPYLDRIANTFASFIYRVLEAMFNLIPNFLKITSPWLPTLVNNLKANIVLMAVVTVCSYILFGYFVFLLIGFCKRLLQSKSLDEVSLGGLYVLSYCVVATIWSYDDQAARFLPMVLPLVWWYFLKPMLPANKGAWWVGGQRVKSGLVIFFLLLSLFPAYRTAYSIGYIRQNHWIDAEGKPLWREYQSAFQYIQTYLPTDAVLASANDTVFYLYTNRKGYYINSATLPIQTIRPLDKALDVILKSYQQFGVNYLLVEPEMDQRSVVGFETKAAKALLLYQPERFRLVYITPLQAIKIYRILPE